MRTLELPSSIVHVMANNNLLTSITFRGQPNELYYMDIRKNRIGYLDIPIGPSLEYLDAIFNPCFQGDKQYVSKEVDAYLKTQHIPNIKFEESDDPSINASDSD